MKLIFIKNFLNICQYKAVPKSLTRMVQCYYKGEQLFYQIVAQNLLQSDTIESSHPKDYHKKDIFKCFTKFTWIHLCRSLFLVALQAFRMPFNYRKTLALMFYCEFCQIFKNIYFAQLLYCKYSNLMGSEKLSILTTEHSIRRKKQNIFLMRPIVRVNFFILCIIILET